MPASPTVMLLATTLLPLCESKMPATLAASALAIASPVWVVAEASTVTRSVLLPAAPRMVASVPTVMLPVVLPKSLIPTAVRSESALASAPPVVVVAVGLPMEVATERASASTSAVIVAVVPAEMPVPVIPKAPEDPVFEMALASPSTLDDVA